MTFQTDSVQICICQECDIAFRSSEMISCPRCMKMAIIAVETVDEMFDDMNHYEQNDVFIDVCDAYYANDAYSGVDVPLYDAKNKSEFVSQMTRLPHPHNYREQYNQYDQYSK